MDTGQRGRKHLHHFLPEDRFTALKLEVLHGLFYNWWDWEPHLWLSPCSVQSSQIQGGSVDLISDAGMVGPKAVPHGHCALTCLIRWLSHL